MPRAKILITMPPAETDAQLTMVTRRLEAATSRLEDMATSVDATHPDTIAAINSASATQGMAAAATAVPTATEPTAPPTEPIPRSVEEFDKIVKEDVQAFATASEQIGGLVEQQVHILRNVLRADADN
jgi:adenylyl cyclase-associated protein